MPDYKQALMSRLGIVPARAAVPKTAPAGYAAALQVAPDSLEARRKAAQDIMTSPEEAADMAEIYAMMDQMRGTGRRIPDPDPYTRDQYQEDLLNMVIDHTTLKENNPQILYQSYSQPMNRQAPRPMRPLNDGAMPERLPVPSQLRQAQMGQLEMGRGITQREMAEIQDDIRREEEELIKRQRMRDMAQRAFMRRE